MSFEGFTEKDFDTYKPAHRGSAMYTLDRRKVKDRLKTLLTQLQANLGADAAGLELVFSSDAPSLENGRSVAEQGAYWIPGPAHQAAVKALVEKMSLKSSTALDVATFHKHASVGVVLDDTGVRVVLSYHPRGQVDRQNLKARLAESWAQDAVHKLIQALDGSFTVLLPGMDAATIPQQVTLDHVVNAAKALDSDAPMLIGHHWPRTSATGDVADKIAMDVRALLPLYAFGVWTPENDHIQAIKAAKAQREEAKKATSLKKGDHVSILTGMWAGKAGVVQEVDKKGVLRVQVGPVTVKLEAKDAQLIPA